MLNGVRQSTPDATTATTQLISSFSVSLLRTDWITSVPHSSSYCLFPPPILLCFCCPIKVKGSQLGVHLNLLSLWRSTRGAPIIQRLLGTCYVRWNWRWKAVTSVSMELYVACLYFYGIDKMPGNWEIDLINQTNINQTSLTVLINVSFCLCCYRIIKLRICWTPVLVWHNQATICKIICGN